MLNLRHRFAALLLPVMLGCAASAVERAVWKLGEPDRSDHEFTTAADAKTNKDVVVRIGTGNETKAWPGFHPGSGNGAFGGRPYRYVLAFDLPRTAPSGVFYLDVSLLFRQPRVPALEIEINGHRGRYYFKPDPIFELSGFNDQFDPIRSAERRKLALPARFFRPGENILVLVAVDDPPTILTNRTTGGTGDSGFFYDSLALTHDPDAAFEDRLEAELMPTILFPKASQGIRQQGDLLVRFPVSWPGGKARVTAGKFVTQVDTPKPAEFGEARFPVLLPDDTPAGPVRIELSERIFNVRFVPAKKWKLFYAPNEHLDVGYTDYRAKVAEVHARNVDDLLKVLTAHPDYRFNIDGSWITDQWLDLRSPRHTRELAAHARAGQIGMNAFYCCPATEYLSLEENFRNLYFSKELQTRYGVPFDFALISDVPSVSWSVPSVLAAAGVRYFADGGNQHRGPLLVHGRWNVRSPFWWEGPDGQRVLAWFSAHYHQLKSLCGLPPAIESAQGGFARFLRAYEQAGYVPDAVLLYGTEVENLPAEYDDAKFVEQWNARYAYPRLITCRFSEFFQYIEKNYATNLPVVRGTGGAYWADNFGALPAATARDRANQMRVLSAESLATLTTTLDPKLRFSHELDRDIWRNILLYSEHNFGTGRATGQPESDEVVGILTEKENWTAEAEHDIDRLMRRSLSQLADQIQTEGRNLVVFNPLSWQRSALVRFQVDNGTTLTNVATGRPVPCEVVSEKDGYQNIRFWAEELPPLGYKVYRLGHVANQGVGSVKKVAQASRPRVDGDLPPHGSSVVGGGTPPTPAGETPALLSVVENRFYKITLDPARAAIRSLYDKELGRELVDGSSPYLLNEYLFVSGGGTETGRGRGAEDTRLLDTFRWLPQADLTVHHPENGVLSGIERTPWGQKIRLTASANHTPRIETEILLPDDVKRIELRNMIQVDFLYAKQASYFAFPWAMSQPTFRYDIANGFVNPAKDLLEGGCSDWFAVQHLVNVEDGKSSVNLATVDAPLVCLGDIYRGRWLPQFTNSSPAVFSYALNNHWSAKWAGKKSGELLYHYAITSESRFDPARAARFGREARCPLEVAELKSSDKLPGRRGTLPPGTASFAGLTPENLLVAALKPAEDGEGLIVRVCEIGGGETDGLLQLPGMAIVSAREANAVEVTGGRLQSTGHEVKFHIKPHQVLTMRLEVRAQKTWQNDSSRIIEGQAK